MKELSFLPRRKIKILDELVARKIAAGEVVDRPLAVLRELLDNAIDAGSTTIDVYLESGGLKSLLVIDNGYGMTEEDLMLCFLPHATSKIETEDDLSRLSSLGFRGEALASLAACSRLTITTAVEDRGLACQLMIEEGRSSGVRKSTGLKGTRVLVEELFSHLPARRRFMKSPATEATLCRRVFEEKALAFPQIAFQLWVDSKLKARYPSESLRQRLHRVAESSWAEADLLEMVLDRRDFSAQVFALKPPQCRHDRKDIHIFANRRPLQEFSLVHAVCCAFENSLPGGAFPCAYVFLRVDPSLVDFNVHPTKREARFRNLPEIHHALMLDLRTALASQKIVLPPRDESFQYQPELSQNWKEVAGTPRSLFSAQPMFSSKSQIWNELRELPKMPSPLPFNQPDEDFRYLGQVLGVFLLVERQGSLYFIDQHAAHEKIIFEQLQSRRSETQELLVPLVVQVNEEAAQQLVHDLERFEALGVSLRRVAETTFEVVKLPQLAQAGEKQLVSFLKEYKKLPQDLEKELYATLACRCSVMDNDLLDPATARQLVRQAFELDDARCPHGRPIWFALTRQDLFKKVGRQV